MLAEKEAQLGGVLLDVAQIVELPLEAAHWIYDWTPYGTTVWIHQ
ncbi:MAG TPA: L,D-transpeptidase [Thermomicrobiaceae bacterium]|nr:L,D-transpeptidase [Thermomicrobiaceae bacterium]